LVAVPQVTASHAPPVHDRHGSDASVNEFGTTGAAMDITSNAIRELSDQECEDIAGGLGWLVVIAVLAGAAAAGSALAILTAPEEEVLVPNIQFPN
jgi:hypothetical protein